MKKDVEAYLALKASEEEKEWQRVSPLARKIAQENRVPLENIQGTGTAGRVMKADVLKAVEQAGGQGAGERPGEQVISMSKMRQVIARRLSESAFTAPHIYLFTDVEMGKILDLRESILEEFGKRFDVRLSINDFLIKAVALAIHDHPFLNASIMGNEIHIHPEINVGLAVALDEGLIVPAIANADRIGLGSIARQRTELVDRAKKGRLTMEEIQRGTFTISSLANFDVTFFTAIINPPQTGILSVGKVQENLFLEKGEVKAKRFSTFGLSADHRIIDGAVAAKFLQTLKKMLENPVFCLLSS
jgi:pyruvate dehydrogenase E2 component (dihydrolipoamide acetyltransferase)